MNHTTGIAKISATGAAVDKPCRLLSVHLAPATAACTAVVTDGNGGTDVLKVTAAASAASNQWRSGGDGIPLAVGAYVTLAGAGAIAYVEYGAP